MVYVFAGNEIDPVEIMAHLAGGAAAGAVIGAVSAPVLQWLLRHPKQRPETALRRNYA